MPEEPKDEGRPFPEPKLSDFGAVTEGGRHAILSPIEAAKPNPESVQDVIENIRKAQGEAPQAAASTEAVLEKTGEQGAVEAEAILKGTGSEVKAVVAESKKEVEEKVATLQRKLDELKLEHNNTNDAGQQEKIKQEAMRVMSEKDKLEAVAATAVPVKVSVSPERRDPVVESRDGYTVIDRRSQSKVMTKGEPQMTDEERNFISDQERGFKIADNRKISDESKAVYTPTDARTGAESLMTSEDVDREVEEVVNKIKIFNELKAGPEGPVKEFAIRQFVEENGDLDDKYNGLKEMWLQNHMGAIEKELGSLDERDPAYVAKKGEFDALKRQYDGMQTDARRARYDAIKKDIPAVAAKDVIPAGTFMGGLTLENIGDAMNAKFSEAAKETDPARKDALMAEVRAMEAYQKELQLLAGRNVTFDTAPVTPPTPLREDGTSVINEPAPTTPEAPAAPTEVPVETPAPAETPVAIEAEATPELGALRNTYVDAIDDLNKWFRGQEDGSEFRGRAGNLVQKLYSGINTLTKSEWQGKPAKQAKNLVDEAVRMMVENNNTASAEKLTAEKALDFAHFGSKRPGIPDVLSPEATEKLKNAIEAQFAYKTRRATMVGEFKAGIPATLTGLEKALKNKELVEKFMVDELAAEDAYRVQKHEVNSKVPKIFRKVGDLASRGFANYAKLPLPLRLAIGITASSAIGIGLGGGGLAVGLGIVGYKAARGLGSYLTGKTGAAAYGFYSDLVKAPKPESYVAEELGKNLEGGKEGLELFEAIEAANKDLVRSKSIEAKVSRRRGIAAMLAGGLFAYESGAFQHAFEPTNTGTGTLTEINHGGINPDAPEGPAATELPGAVKPSVTEVAPSGPKAVDIEGYKVGKGGSIWQGVREQVKSYVSSDNADPNQLGIKMTPEEFKSFQADILDKGTMTPEHQHLLDRVIATSITKNHMMNMGIRAPGEVVTWKPGADGGSIEFSSGDKALYDMHTGKPVSLDHLPQDHAPTGAQVPQPEGIEQHIDQAPQGGYVKAENMVQQTELDTRPTQEVWATGLSQSQLEQAQRLITEYKQSTGLDIDSPDGVGNVQVGTLYDTLKPGTPGGVTMVINSPDGVVHRVMIPDEVTRIRDTIVPTQPEMNYTLRDLIKARITQKGSSVLVEPKPSPNVVVLPKAAPLPTPSPVIPNSPTNP